MEEKIDTLIERTYSEIAQFGDGKLEFETRDIERLAKLAEKFVNLQESIALHQEKEDSNTCSIGELVLDELDMWG